MDCFNPEKLIGHVFLDEQPLPLPNQSDVIVEHYSESPKMGFWQERSCNGSISVNTNGEFPLPPVNQSAFVQYGMNHFPYLTGFGYGEEISQNGSNSKNMKKRMIEFLRRSWSVQAQEKRQIEEYERERCFRHKINERMRRQRQRHCSLALHSMLPHGAKTDTNSVIQMAAKEIQRLQGCKEELQRKNSMLEANVVEAAERGNKVKLRVPCPTSGIDFVIETLKCLKGLGLNTSSIRSNFSREVEIEIFTD